MSFCVNTRRRARDGECPCRGCEERYVGCHGVCGKYTAWDKRNRESREERQKKIFLDGQADRRKKIAIEQYNRRKAR